MKTKRFIVALMLLLVSSIVFAACSKVADYTVEYYKEQADGSFSAVENSKLSGETGADVQAAEKKYTGFTYDAENAKNVKSGKITKDGKLTLKLYYKLNRYTVAFIIDNQQSDVQTVKYGDKITAPTQPEKTGYTFSEWQYSFATYDFNTLVTEDMSLVAKFNPKTDTAYKAVYYKQAKDGSYTVAETLNLQGTTAEEVTAEIKTYTGYEYAENAEGSLTKSNIAADGTLILKVYYNRVIELASETKLVDLSLKSGQTNTASVVITASSAGEDAKSDVVWASENPATATVENGLITAAGKGNAVISATLGAKKVEITVNVWTALISDGQGFYDINNDLTGNYMLAGDIDFGGIDNPTQIGPEFSGIFNGNGFALKNFSIGSGTKWNQGVFNTIKGTVKNTSFFLNKFRTNNTSGAIGFKTLGGTIENIYVNIGELVNSGINTGYPSGLIVAYNDGGKLDRCTVCAKWSSSSVMTSINKLFHLGQLQDNGKYTNCYSIINIPDGTGISTYAYENDIIMRDYQDIVAATDSEVDLTSYLSGVTSIINPSKGNNFSVELTASGDGLITIDGTKLKTTAAGEAYFNINFKKADGSYVESNGNKATLKVKVNVFDKILTAPANVKIASTDVTWDSVIGAKGYKISISADGAEANEYTCANSEFDLSDIIKVKGTATYSVKVCTLSALDSYGDYGATVEKKIYAISNAAEFIAIKNDFSGTYALTSDIDMAAAEDLQIGGSGTSFKGVLDGNGYSVNNFSIGKIKSTWCSSLFRDMSGTIENITFNVNKYTSGMQTAVIALANKGVIKNIYLYINEIVDAGTNSQPFGLIAAYNNAGTISDCVVSGNWSTSSTVTASASQMTYAGQQQNNGVYSDIFVLLNVSANYNVRTTALGQTIVINNFANITLTAGATSDLSVYTKEGYSLSFALSDQTAASVSGNVLTATAAGSTKLYIAFKNTDSSEISANGKQAVLIINVTVTAA